LQKNKGGGGGRGGEYQSKTTGAGAKAIMSSKEQGATKRATSWCNREIPKQTKGVARKVTTSSALNKEQQEE
jgi:hypothetical protein